MDVNESLCLLFQPNVFLCLCTSTCISFAGMARGMCDDLLCIPYIQLLWHCRDTAQRVEQLAAFGGFSDTKYLERTLAKEFNQLEEWYEHNLQASISL